MNLKQLDRALRKAGHAGIDPRGRDDFDGATMTTYNERDEPTTTEFASEDAMCRALFAKALRQDPPRSGAVLHESAIRPLKGNALWQVSYPAESMLRARADGLLAVLDTSGLVADPKHGAAQVTILDAATGGIRSTWLPPHGVVWARFEGGNLIVDDEKQNATICDPLTGRVIGPTEVGVREKWQDGLLPNILEADRTRSRLSTSDGKLLWEREGYVRSGKRTHGLSIINLDNAETTEAVRDDGSTVWSVKGMPATVTADTVWVDAGEHLLVINIETGEQLSKSRAPWSEFQLYGLHNGWDPTDGLVLIDSDEWLAMYPA